MLDEQVHNQLRAHRKVEELEKSIYDIGVKLFGVQRNGQVEGKNNVSNSFLRKTS